MVYCLNSNIAAITCPCSGNFIHTVFPVSLISENAHEQQRETSSVRRKKSSVFIGLGYGRMTSFIDVKNSDEYTNEGFDTDDYDTKKGK